MDFIFILLIIVFFELLISGSVENDKISLILYHSIIVEMVVIIITIFIQIF